MALLPYSQIGDNLYADQSGKYFNINKGYRNYVQSPFDTQSTKLNQVYDAQKNNQLNLLKQQREKAVSGFNQQKKELAPQYQSQRNQADVVNAQGVSRLRELMAANGISASGENVTASSNLQAARQTSLNDVTNNEQTAYRDINKQIADVNDPSQEQAIIQAIEVERSKALSDAYAQAQQQQYTQMVDWRNYQMQKQQFELDQQIKRQQLANSKKASGGGGGGGGGRRKSTGHRSSSSKKSPSQSSSKTTTATNSYNKAKTSSYSSPLDQYYNNPAIQAGQATGSKYFSNPLPPAQNPYLTDWEKMKMLGL